MKRVFWIIMTSVLFFACNQGVPASIIHEDNMEKILFDIHLVDGYLSTVYPPDSAKKVAAAYYKGIYKKYNIDSATYSKSLKFYNANPTLLEKIYKKIETRLVKQQNLMKHTDSLMKKKLFKLDSLSFVKKFKDDSSVLAKKIKPDSVSKAKGLKEMIKKRKVRDSLINQKKINMYNNAVI